jgi:hypothetical protein
MWDPHQDGNDEDCQTNVRRATLCSNGCYHDKKEGTKWYHVIDVTGKATYTCKWVLESCGWNKKGQGSLSRLLKGFLFEIYCFFLLLLYFLRQCFPMKPRLASTPDSFYLSRGRGTSYFSLFESRTGWATQCAPVLRQGTWAHGLSPSVTRAVALSSLKGAQSVSPLFSGEALKGGGTGPRVDSVRSCNIWTP